MSPKRAISQSLRNTKGFSELSSMWSPHPLPVPALEPPHSDQPSTEVRLLSLLKRCEELAGREDFPSLAKEIARTAAENDMLRADIEKDLVDTAGVPAVARSLNNNMLCADIEKDLVDTAGVPAVARGLSNNMLRADSETDLTNIAEVAPVVRSISCGPCAHRSAASLPSSSTEKAPVEQLLCKGGNGVVNRTDTWIHARPQHRYHRYERYQRQSYRTWPHPPVNTDLATLEVLTKKLQRTFTPG